MRAPDFVRPPGGDRPVASQRPQRHDLRRANRPGVPLRSRVEPELGRRDSFPHDPCGGSRTRRLLNGSAVRDEEILTLPITILVVTFNSAGWIARCLDSVGE